MEKKPSQCPCCGRSMCGTIHDSPAQTRRPDRVSMPLLRAVDVRAPTSACLPIAATASCLNALVAGGRCAGFCNTGMETCDNETSQCPCCGRSMCGRRTAGSGAAKLRTVSMPLLRAVDVRADSSVAACKAGYCLNALVAGGRCAGASPVEVVNSGTCDPGFANLPPRRGSGSEFRRSKMERSGTIHHVLMWLQRALTYPCSSRSPRLALGGTFCLSRTRSGRLAA